MTTTRKCELVTPTELARIFGVSRKWVYKLAEKGMPRDGRHFDLAACVQWYMAELKAPGSSEEQADVTEARRQLYIEQTEKTRLENARMRAESVDVEEARAILYGVASIVATQHDPLAPRLAGLVLGETDVKRVQQLLFDELRAIRQSIADAVMALPQPGGGDDGTATEAHSRPVGGRQANTPA